MTSASADEAYRRLSRLSNRLSFGLTALIVVAVLAMNLSIVWAPDWLAASPNPHGFVPRGFYIAGAVIILSIAATAYAVHMLNSRMDALRQLIREQEAS